MHFSFLFVCLLSNVQTDPVQHVSYTARAMTEWKTHYQYYQQLHVRNLQSTVTYFTCCLLPLRVSMTNCMVSVMSVSASAIHGGPAPPFFNWLFSCSGIATSSWCTFTASPLRCCKSQQRRLLGFFSFSLKVRKWKDAEQQRTCRFSSIILSRACMKSSSSAQATCFSPPPRIDHTAGQ